MKLNCGNTKCRYVWEYGGKAKFYASCPRCKSSVRIGKQSRVPTGQEIIKKIEQHKETIRSFGLKKLILFGSHARNEATKDSDLDFLVEFKEGRGLFDDYVHLLHFLQDLFGKEQIDLVKLSLVREELKESILGGKQVAAKL